MAFIAANFNSSGAASRRALAALRLSGAFFNLLSSPVPQSKSSSSGKDSPGPTAVAPLHGLSTSRGTASLDGTDAPGGMQHGTRVPWLAALPFMGGARINCQLRCCCCLWRLLGIALLEPCMRPSPPAAAAHFLERSSHLSMIELVGDPSHPFADCGCRRGSRQRMQNKIKKKAASLAAAASGAPVPAVPYINKTRQCVSVF